MRGGGAAAGASVRQYGGQRDVRKSARELLTRSYCIVPLLPQQKRCIVDGWQHLRITEEEIDNYFEPGANVGIHLGEASGSRVDVDLDCSETLALADALLPATRSIFGRVSTPRSHRLFCAPDAQTVKFVDPDRRPDEAMLVELRSTGAQTMAPGSIHPGGEAVEWAEDGEPAEIDADELRRQVAGVAAAALLVRLYPGQGSRHDYILALTGALARALPENEALRMLDAIARAAGDEEYRARRADLRSTLRRLAEEQPATGWPTLTRWLGEKRTACVREWLGCGESASAQAEWLALQPLPAELPPVPTMPSSLLPVPFRPWLLDAAERLQVPLEMVAVPALTAFGSLIGRQLGILPKLYDDWLVVPNLWGTVVARPGYLKSPAMREAVRPISRLAAEAAKEHKAKKLLMDAKRGAIETKIAKLKREAMSKNGDPESMQARLQNLLEELEKAVATERRFMTSDPTVEKLGELMLQNPAGLLLLRDELSGWLRNLEKPGREGDREFYIEGWNGTGRFDVDRIGRGTLHIEAVTVSIFGTIQPGKLTRYIAGATGADATADDDGLLQRFQLVVWPDFSGDWIDVDRWPAKDARETAFAVFKAASALEAQLVRATDDDSEIQAIRFDERAQELFRDWRGKLERRLRSGELAATPAFESHVAKFRKLMPALALIQHVAEVLGTNPSVSSVPSVGLAAAKNAAALVDFFEAHARRLYADELGRARPIRALAEKIESGAVRDGDAVRDIRRRGLSGLDSQEAVEAAVAGLTDLGWVRSELLKTDTKAKRVIRLNPALLEGGRHG